MVNKSTQVNIKNRHGSLTAQQQETDSPIIPVAQLERLQQFKPDAVDWVINQTQVEAEYRRKETKRVNTFIFAQRFLGQIFAFLMGLSGIGAGSYVAIKGEAWAGAMIASFALTVLAVVFLTGKNTKQ